MLRNIIIFSLLLALYYKPASATPINTLKSDQADVTLLGGSYADNKIRLGLNFNLKPGWHIYWHDAGDTGFPPVLDWNSTSNLSGAELSWPTPKRLRQELQPGSFLESYVYADNVTFPITITPKDGSQPVDIDLHISYAICAETCIPGQAELGLKIEPGFKSPEDLQIIENAEKFIPKENGTDGLKIESVNKNTVNGKDTIEVKASSTKDFSSDTTILVTGGEHFAFYNPTTSVTGKTASFSIPVTYLTSKKDLSDSTLNITLINGEEAVELTVNTSNFGAVDANTQPKSAKFPTPSETPKSTEYSFGMLILMIISGFIGGLILNIMPCVLPILSIKILGVIKHGGGQKYEVKASFIMTALGILVSFIGFAIVTIWLKKAGEVVGWGFHFQEPYFIITLIVILALFAANLWGLFEIRLPSFLSSIGTKYEGMAGHFMSGVLATILATPCTAPFLGTAVGFSVTRGTFEILVIFTAMGLGLAFPYLLFSLIPGMVTKLPKPGAWMLKVKKIMAILLALAALWLIWVLSNQIGGVKPANQATQKIWGEFKPENIPELVSGGKIVFVDVTADWCLTCKVNKLAVLDRDEIKDAFLKNNVVAMKADWTNRDNNIAKYLMKYERVGIPFNIIYGPGAPDGIVLSELLSKKDVLAALQRAGRK